MSADLAELRQDLPEIQLPRVNVIITSSPPDRNISVIKEEEEEEEECRTPRSPRNLIPETVVCPPAPMKPRRPVIRCKRKLTELNFLEMVAREEVDSLFRPSAAASPTKIRRCLV
ncbi:unnamed protein product [Cuscuta campestris]|uniref:Uncharacterized protein n=1 Tax=Cuscuta campestris TaxID=132261 RepID=A0A484M4H2_9ASTE|nr:unnamed protein product [Cuscuta campestris]